MLTCHSEWPIQAEKAARRQNTAGATKQRLRYRPRRDVDHVDADDCIGGRDWPLRISDIKVKRPPHVCLRLQSSPSRNRTKTILVLSARLPRKMPHHVREMDGVLSCPASNFQHESRLRQDLRKHLRNGFSVALSRRAREPAVTRGVQIFEPHARYLPMLAACANYLSASTTGPATGSVTPRPPPRSSKVSRKESRVAIICGRAFASASMSVHSAMIRDQRGRHLTWPHCPWSQRRRTTACILRGHDDH